MNKGELIVKLAVIKWDDFNVKEPIGEEPKSAWEAVSAFTNTACGWLVFGVKQLGYSLEVLKNLKTHFEENLALFPLNFDAFVNALQHSHNLSSEMVRRGFGEKPAFLLFLISHDNVISAKTATQYLHLNQPMVKRYIAKLKNECMLEREMGDLGGKWLLK